MRIRTRSPTWARAGRAMLPRELLAEDFSILVFAMPRRVRWTTRRAAATRSARLH